MRWLFVLLGSIALFGCIRRKSREEATLGSDTLGEQPLEPLPLKIDYDPATAALGEVLFGEPRLSGDAKVACTDCHHQDHGLADEKPHSFVAGRPETPVNTPGLYNVRYLYKLNWNGKFDSLETHIDGLMKNPKVMASSWETATKHWRKSRATATNSRASFGTA